MPTNSGLREAFIDELKDSYDAEKQLLKALRKLASAATEPELRQAFESHLEETRGHVTRLEQVFQMLGERATGKHCDGIAGIIKEGASVMDEDFEDATMDACLVASGQRAEHYEISAYGTLIAWAQALGLDEVVPVLQETLNEEKAADHKLTSLAEGGINEAAVGEDSEGSARPSASVSRAGSSGRPSSKGSGRSTRPGGGARGGRSSGKRGSRSGGR